MLLMPSRLLHEAAEVRVQNVRCGNHTSEWDKPVYKMCLVEETLPDRILIQKAIKL